MRIKIISHKSMKNSVNYLYKKLEMDDTNLFTRFSPNETSKSFLDDIKNRMEEQEMKTGKKLDVNNTIKHLVITFHPDDTGKLDRSIDDILEDFFTELNINPENHHLNIFEHNDRAHKHYHVILSRIGIEGELFNDQNLAWRINDLAKMMDKKYDLTVSKNPKISIFAKYLYNPTTRGDLLKLINFATLDSKSLTDFQQIMKKYGVITRKSENGEFTYITKDRKTFHEKRLPKGAWMSNLYTYIKTQNHSKEYLEFRSKIQKMISDCSTLQELKGAFPESVIKYQRDGDLLRNISISHQGITIKLHEVAIQDAIVAPNSNENYMDLPIFFIPYMKDTSYEEAHEEYLRKKYGKKTRQLGFKHQI